MGYMKTTKALTIALLGWASLVANFAHAAPIGIEQGQAMAQQGKWANLLETAQAALAQTPNDVRWQLLLGVAQAQSQQYNKALATFQDMVKRHPELPEAHNNLGLVLAAMGKPNEARQAFEQALRANPQFALAKKNLNLLPAPPAAAAAPARATP
jgi:tetratricopeptide (TPR) repeat protein